MTRTLNIPASILGQYLPITNLDTPVVLRTNPHRGPSNFQRFASLAEMIERVSFGYQGDWVSDTNETQSSDDDAMTDVATFLTAMRALDDYASWVVLDASGLERAEAAAADLRKAEDHLYYAMNEASIAGHSLRAIANVVGMSHEKVRQVLETGEI